MTPKFEAELRAAGYTDAQIAKEAAYMARIAWENARIRSERGWNYGLHGAEA